MPENPLYEVGEVMKRSTLPCDLRPSAISTRIRKEHLSGRVDWTYVLENEPDTEYLWEELSPLDPEHPVYSENGPEEAVYVPS